ncbi:MAG: dUTP diphosphatase [Candidatus Binataceae bacterium]
MMSIQLRIQRLRKGRGPLPAYHSAHAAGLDLSADLDSPLTIAPGARASVPTGIALEIPAGYEGQVRPRSGRAIADGLTLINSPGTIDSDYRGEINVLLVNLGTAPIEIRSADRIAQLVIAPVVRVELVEVADLGNSARGCGGFGHTGR